MATLQGPLITHFSPAGAPQVNTVHIERARVDRISPGAFHPAGHTTDETGVTESAGQFFQRLQRQA